MRTLLIRPLARLDLLEIWHFIAERNLNSANRVGERFDQAIRDLLLMPGKGHSRADVRNPHYRPHYRFWVVYSYVIAYRFDDTSLTIVRVVHGARNIRGLFNEDKM